MQVLVMIDRKMLDYPLVNKTATNSNQKRLGANRAWTKGVLAGRAASAAATVRCLSTDGRGSSRTLDKQQCWVFFVFSNKSNMRCGSHGLGKVRKRKKAWYHGNAAYAPFINSVTMLLLRCSRSREVECSFPNAKSVSDFRLFPSVLCFTVPSCRSLAAVAGREFPPLFKSELGIGFSAYPKGTVVVYLSINDNNQMERND